MVCVGIAFISFHLGERIPLVGGPVFALMTGIGLNLLVKHPLLDPGLKFTSKTLLKVAIVLLGLNLNIGQILAVGKISFTVMVFTLTAAFGFGAIFGRLLNINWKLSSLISAGTGLCGGSAVAALSPVIGARDSDLTYAISATFLFDVAMVLLFPLMGRALGLSDLAYGLWTGSVQVALGQV